MFNYPIETLKKEIDVVTDSSLELEKHIVTKEEELNEINRLRLEEITSLNDALKIERDKLQSLEEAIKKLAND